MYKNVQCMAALTVLSSDCRLNCASFMMFIWQTAEKHELGWGIQMTGYLGSKWRSRKSHVFYSSDPLLLWVQFRSLHPVHRRSSQIFGQMLASLQASANRKEQKRRESGYVWNVRGHNVAGGGSKPFPTQFRHGALLSTVQFNSVHCN